MLARSLEFETQLSPFDDHVLDGLFRVGGLETRGQVEDLLLLQGGQVVHTQEKRGIDLELVGSPLELKKIRNDLGALVELEEVDELVGHKVRGGVFDEGEISEVHSEVGHARRLYDTEGLAVDLVVAIVGKELFDLSDDVVLFDLKTTPGLFEFADGDAVHSCNHRHRPVKVMQLHQLLDEIDELGETGGSLFHAQLGEDGGGDPVRDGVKVLDAVHDVGGDLVLVFLGPLLANELCDLDLADEVVIDDGEVPGCLLDLELVIKEVPDKNSRSVLWHFVSEQEGDLVSLVLVEEGLLITREDFRKTRVEEGQDVSGVGGIILL